MFAAGPGILKRMIRLLRPTVITGLLLALLIVPQHADARDHRSLPSPHGERFYAATLPQTLPGLEPLPPRQSAPETEAWKQRIREAEYANGPYGQGIAETLLDAANYFASRGDYLSALAHWRRSVHLVRVNEGLYSPLQLPALSSQLDMHLRLGDFESAGEVKSYLYFLARRHYEPGDPELVAAAVDWIEWRRQQWLRAPNPEQPRDLLSLWRELDRHTREDESRVLGLSELAALTYAQINVLYVVGTEDFGIDRETEMMLGRGPASADAALDIDRAQIQALQDAAYARGRQRLELLLERAAEAGDGLEQARANRALGDWYLWHGSSRRAAPHYRDSWHQLQALSLPELQQEWYASPMELPADNVMWVPPSPLEGDGSARVLARFDVDERGRPRGVETEPVDPERDAQAIRLTRLLRDSRFRPRLEAGEMVVTRSLEREYRVP